MRSSISVSSAPAAFAPTRPRVSSKPPAASSASRRMAIAAPMGLRMSAPSPGNPE
ncbi:hypothetical protein [Corynebacterium hansenii]|uniref:hypothetical protein n=1 Tax=Corynebacterium hansenii TaxID=394964 RepID=UPI0025B4E0DA|nr:hypothetical protein [Corynebacterium hansenii]